MLKRTVLFLAILSFMILALPVIAQLTETAEVTKDEVEAVLQRYIDAVGGREAIEKIKTRICKGHLITDLKSREQPVYEDHYYEAYASLPNLYQTSEFSDAGTFVNACDGTSGWSQDRCGVKKDDYRANSKIAWILNPQNALKIKDYFPDLIYDGQKVINGKQTVKLSPANRDETYYALYFDLESGLLVSIGYYWTLEDYRKVDGVLFPHRIVTSRKGGSATYIFDQVINNQPVDNDRFKIPDK